MLKPGGAFEIIMAYVPDHDPNAFAGEPLSSWTMLASRRSSLPMRSRLRSNTTRLTQDEALAIASTWGRRLLHARPRPVMLVSGIRMIAGDSDARFRGAALVTLCQPANRGLETGATTYDANAQPSLRPANRDNMVAKAHQTPADVIVLDLEDSVPMAEKEARAASSRGLDASLKEAGKTVHVRVNGLDTGLTRDDLAAAIGRASTG